MSIMAYLLASSLCPIRVVVPIEIKLRSVMLDPSVFLSKQHVHALIAAIRRYKSRELRLYVSKALTEVMKGEDRVAFEALLNFAHLTPTQLREISFPAVADFFLTLYETAELADFSWRWVERVPDHILYLVERGISQCDRALGRPVGEVLADELVFLLYRSEILAATRRFGEMLSEYFNVLVISVPRILSGIVALKEWKKRVLCSKLPSLCSKEFEALKWIIGLISQTLPPDVSFPLETALFLLDP